jgi:LAGLIDADG endonuclease
MRFNLRFELSQRTKDIYLLYAISIFLGFGNVISNKEGMSNLSSANLI